MIFRQKTFKIIFAIFLLAGLNQIKPQDAVMHAIGTNHKLHSNILNEEREYFISLPDSYNKEGNYYKKYPLLIILDGNVHFNLFSTMVNQMSSYIYRSCKIPEMIVVGIKNVDRRRDYTPDKIVTIRENNSGGGENFLRFLETELIPELDNKYRTLPYRILFGHSLGGLLATHTYMKEQSLFNSFIAADPSMGTWDEKRMDEKIEKVTGNSFERYIYIATANWGKRNFNNRDRHIRLYEALHRKCSGNFKAKIEYFENENHSSVPLPAFYNGISAIFKGYGISYRDIENTGELIKHFQVISKRLSWNFIPPEFLVNRIGYRFLQSRNISHKKKALEFFLLNTKNYPESFNAFDSLGEAYESLGNPQRAIESYMKSLKLNPQNHHAQSRIDYLKLNFAK